ncbi:recombinase family protein [Sphingomonas sp. ASY06-1R]|uniref:recombinase family protein n=1 Tax=Sphingomonas sp. ASY06-1R TaxID=3445771 RepID=UPI003FA210A7
MKKAPENNGRKRAYAYLRLSVDREGGAPQSIEAQRNAIRAYAKKHDLEIVEEFADAGFSGQTQHRPEFQRMVAQATADDRPVDTVLIYMLSRLARSMRLFFNTIGDLEDAGVEVISTTEDFGKGRSRRIGHTISAMFAEEQARDAAVLTRKSRRENARQGFYNGGLIAFGYRTYVARQDDQKSRMKLEIVPEEAAIVRQIFDWADAGRGGRWIVKTLNEQGHTLRGARFTNGNVAGILAREIYAGEYLDRTADDDGRAPDREEAITVSCPAIIERDQHERVAAIRAARNPRKTAPHVAAATTLLVGVARCGMPGCASGMTIRTGKSGRYAYYACNDRVNRGGKCTCPSIRREQLDSAVLEAIERQLLEPNRLRTLLNEVINLSDQRRADQADELSRVRAEQTRVRTAISNLLVLVEQGVMGPRDPAFAERMAFNRAQLASLTSRIDTLETQLARGSRRITEQTVDRFGALLKAKLREDDPTLRSSYLRMFVSEVRVSESEIAICGPTAALEAGVATGLPRGGKVVPIFDREWCPGRDSNSRPAV